MAMTEQSNHAWPSNPGDHLWGPWMPKDRTTIWRRCVHPSCPAIEERKAQA